MQRSVNNGFVQMIVNLDQFGLSLSTIILCVIVRYMHFLYSRVWNLVSM